MTIDGVNISTTYNAKVKQWRVSVDTRNLKHDSEWERGSPLPIFQAPSATFKDFTVTLMVYGDSRDDIMCRVSNILSTLTDTVELAVDNWSHGFCGILEKSSVKELSDYSRNRFMELSLQFTGYEHGEETTTEISAAGTSSAMSFTVDNPGNVASPLALELTPTIGQSSVTVTGICRDSQTGEDLPVTINSLTTENTVVLDGVTGLITENGSLKAGDVDMWALPTVLPGDNTVTVSSGYFNVIAKVLPIYM